MCIRDRGTSDEVLLKGVGHLEGSSYPLGGDSTHSVLTGHRGLAEAVLFTDLDKMQEGDKFYLHVMDEVLALSLIHISFLCRMWKRCSKETTPPPKSCRMSRPTRTRPPRTARLLRPRPPRRRQRPPRPRPPQMCIRDRSGAIVAVTGAIDLVSDGKTCYVIRNGRPEMGKIRCV